MTLNSTNHAYVNLKLPTETDLNFNFKDDSEGSLGETCPIKLGKIRTLTSGTRSTKLKA